MKHAEARFSAVLKHAEAKNPCFPSEAMRKRAEARRKHAEAKKNQKRRASAHAMCVRSRVAKTMPSFTMRNEKMTEEVKFMATPFDLEEVTRRMKEENQRQLCRKPSDPDDQFGYRVNSQDRYIDVYWGAYCYSIPLDELSTPERLLWKLHHLSKKTWPGMTLVRVRRLIESMAREFGWEMYADAVVAPLSVRTTSDAEERSKLTPKLRYDVLTRDNFRCRACGASPETGAHLHIDHIKPISDGGLTLFENLQALCSPCNYGKGARK